MHDRPPAVLAALTAGFALALGMWVVWLAAHLTALGLHGGTASHALIGAVAMAVLLLGAGLIGRLVGRGGWGVGAGAGCVAGLLGLLLLGAQVVVQPATTGEMDHAANRLRPDAWITVLGFLAVCTVLAGVGGAIGSRTAPPGHPAPRTGRWLAWMGVLAAAAMLPLIVLGGFVTGTGSGLAVPDGVTTYGAFAALFPISLMNEPRIFLEHSHRLFGNLVGLTALVLAVVALVKAPAGRWVGLGAGLVLLVAAAGAMGAGHAGAVSESVATALLGGVGLLTLGFAHGMLGRQRAAAACCGLFVLVCIQGFLGIMRVDERLAWAAAFHGVFAQFVFATACMVAAALSPLATDRGPMDEATADAASRVRLLATMGVGVTSLQIILGAMTRHFDSLHAVLTHAVFSVVVVVLAAIVGFRARRAGADAMGRTLHRCGTLVLLLLFLQFAMGWAALGVTQVHGPERPVPTADQLPDAGPIPVFEAAVTTAHQTGGALLLGSLALTLYWARRGARRAAAAPAAPIADAPPADAR